VRGLILRLSEIDSAAEAAMRVVAYFDALVQGGAGLDAVLRSTASLIGTRTGFVDAVTGEEVTSDGEPAPTQPSLSSDVQVAGTAVGRVWLEAGAPGGELDELVLERMALTIAGLWPSYGRWLPSDALTLLRADATPDARDAARRRLNLGAGDRCAVVAVVGGTGRSAHVSEAVRAGVGSGRIEAVADDGTEVVALIRGDLDVADMAVQLGRRGYAAGSCAADSPGELPRARREASATARLADAAPGLLGRFVRAEDLGSLVRLADVPTTARADDGDVRALLALAGAGRAEDLDLLEAFLATGTLRAAGERVHRHHSSVASRLDRLQKELDLVLDEPRGRTRAFAALVLARLAQRETEDRHPSS
jgi:hypothetical protein